MAKSRPNPSAPRCSRWWTTSGNKAQSAAEGIPKRHRRRSSRRVHGECRVNRRPPRIDRTSPSRVGSVTGPRGITPTMHTEHVTKTHYIEKPAVAPDSTDNLEPLGAGRTTAAPEHRDDGRRRAA